MAKRQLSSSERVICPSDHTADLPLVQHPSKRANHSLNDADAFSTLLYGFPSSTATCVANHMPVASVHPSETRLLPTALPSLFDSDTSPVPPQQHTPPPHHDPDDTFATLASTVLTAAPNAPASACYPRTSVDNTTTLDGPPPPPLEALLRHAEQALSAPEADTIMGQRQSPASTDNQQVRPVEDMEAAAILNGLAGSRTKVPDSQTAAEEGYMGPEGTSMATHDMRTRGPHNVGERERVPPCQDGDEYYASLATLILLQIGPCRSYTLA
jgi:hypothetical protein